MLAPWKESHDQPIQHIKKHKHYFVNKGLSSQSYGFSSSHVWMWELYCKESWRIDAFELWCWRRLLRVPWTARRSNLSILKEVSPEYSLEGLMLKLKLQYFGHLMQRMDSSEKIPILGKIEGRRRGATENEIVGWHHWLDGHEFKQPLGDGDLQGSLLCYSPRGRKESDMTDQLNWTEIPWPSGIYPWNVKLVFYLKINQCNTFIKEQKSYDHLNKYRRHLIKIQNIHDLKSTKKEKKTVFFNLIKSI